MMLTRILTAIVLIPLVLWLVLNLSHFGFGIFAGLICLLAGWEWAGLCRFGLPGKMGFELALLLVGVGLTWFNPLLVGIVGCLLWIAATYWVISYQGQAPKLLEKPFSRAVIGVLFLAIAWHALFTLHALPFAKYWIILLFLLVWCTDIFAYFVGKFWGKQPLIPLVSPKKTWAGFWGGFLGSGMIAVLSYVFFHFSSLTTPPLFQRSPDVWLSIAVLIIFLSVMGDLFESLIKRIAGVKDSGSLLPGHGGILDRIDSLVAALPFFTLSLQWVGGA